MKYISIQDLIENREKLGISSKEDIITICNELPAREFLKCAECDFRYEGRCTNPDLTDCLDGGLSGVEFYPNSDFLCGMAKHKAQKRSTVVFFDHTKNQKMSLKSFLNHCADGHGCDNCMYELTSQTDTPCNHCCHCVDCTQCRYESKI